MYRFTLIFYVFFSSFQNISSFQRIASITEQTAVPSVYTIFKALRKKRLRFPAKQLEKRSPFLFSV